MFVGSKQLLNVEQGNWLRGSTKFAYSLAQIHVSLARSFIPPTIAWALCILIAAIFLPLSVYTYFPKIAHFSASFLAKIFGKSASFFEQVFDLTHYFSFTLT
jgi:hypothetical protein